MDKTTEPTTSYSAVYRDTKYLHPIAKPQFELLATRLVVAHKEGKTHSLFLPFETFRDPHRQAIILSRGRSKAKAWQSPHQYGLATDFVAKQTGQWSWADDEDWLFLHDEARQIGLSAPITWDLCHIEHPSFDSKIRPLLMFR